MKKLTLFLITILLTTIAVFAFENSRPAASENYISDNYVRSTFNLGNCNDRDQKVEYKGAVPQFELEITGSECNGYDIDAVNPGDRMWKCSASGTLKGDSGEESIDSSDFTISSTKHGRFNALGKVTSNKNLHIKSFSVKCDDVTPKD